MQSKPFTHDKINNEILKLGNEIDKAINNKDITLLSSYRKNAEEILTNETLTENEKAVIYYYIGRICSAIDSLHTSKTNDIWLFNRVEFEKTIINYRKCINLDVSSEIEHEVFTKAYTNLGNSFSTAGRAILAIKYWNKSLVIDPEFEMALCNKAHGIKEYSDYLYLRNHRIILLKKAYQIYKHCVDSNTIPRNSKEFFQSEFEMLNNLSNTEFLDAEFNFEPFSLGNSEAEKEYKKWLLNNSLFLNPLNDIFSDSFVAHDSLTLPSMLIKDNPAPIFQGFYNQIKQEFISLRYFYYQYSHLLHEYEVHFSDSERHLADTCDYPVYGYRTECLKISFRMAYSILDKIAFFLNKYLVLNIPDNKVNFRTMWFEKGGKGNVRDSIQKLENLPLRALYFLSRDLFSPAENSYLINLEPESKNISDIRNHLEHRYFKIHCGDWSGETLHTGNSFDMFIDNLAYSVFETDFSKKTLYLIHMVREAIIYLALAVHQEEKKLDSDENILGLTLPEYV
jgi:tetratricopeptide (TPR) repeat protein